MQSSIGVGDDAVPAFDRHALMVPDTVMRGQIVWPYAITIGLMHVFALTAVLPARP
jgi:hypothetical protein